MGIVSRVEGLGELVQSYNCSHLLKLCSLLVRTLNKISAILEPMSTFQIYGTISQKTKEQETAVMSIPLASTVGRLFI